MSATELILSNRPFVRLTRRFSVALVLALLSSLAYSFVPTSAAGETLRLGLPLACTPGTDCWVVNYVDDDPGPGASDFSCGPRSYDGHKGTDFGLLDLRTMAEGVAVLAASDGTVKALRDGMPDTGTDTPAEILAGQDCGNGLIVEHAGGWSTQYCHMRMGSVAVAKGQAVVSTEHHQRIVEYPAVL